MMQDMLVWFGVCIPYLPFRKLRVGPWTEHLEQKVHRSMLFALSLIDSSQAALAMVEVAKKGNNEISNLAKAFIDKRDQGIWNKYKIKGLLAGEKLAETTYIDRLLHPVWTRVQLPKISEILKLKGNPKNGKKCCQALLCLP